jgi:hypothetical protein
MLGLLGIIDPPRDEAIGPWRNAMTRASASS